MATREQQALIKRKAAIAYQIRNIKQDYDTVLAEDIPNEIKSELNKLMAELRDLREKLDNV